MPVTVVLTALRPSIEPMDEAMSRILLEYFILLAREELPHDNAHTVDIAG